MLGKYAEKIAAGLTPVITETPITYVNTRISPDA